MASRKVHGKPHAYLTVMDGSNRCQAPVSEQISIHQKFLRVWTSLTTMDFRARTVLQAGKQMTANLASLVHCNANSGFVLEALVEEMHESKELTCYQLINHPYSEQIILGIIRLISSSDASISGNAAYVIGSLCELEVARRRVITIVTRQSIEQSGLLESLTKLLYSKDVESRMNASGAIGTVAEIQEGRAWLLRNPVLDDTIAKVSYLLHGDDIWTASNCSLIIARLTIDEEGCARILNRRDCRKLLLRLVRALGCDKAGKGMNAGFALGRLCDMPSGGKYILMLKQRDVMLNKLIEMLATDDLGCKKNACFALSSIAASDEGHALLMQHAKLGTVLEILIETVKQEDEEAAWFAAMLIRTLSSKRHGCLLLRDKANLKDCLQQQIQREDLKEDVRDEIDLTLQILKRLEKPMPILVKVESATTAVASWDAINPKSGLEVTYHLFQGKHEVYTGKETTFTAQDLKPTHKYSYSLRASTEGDLSPFSDTVHIETPETVPSAPQQFRVVGRSTSQLKVAWQPPQEENGILKRYQLLKLGSQELCINTVQLSHIFSHLAAGTEYEFELYALTSAGKGEKATLKASTVDLKEHAPASPSLMVLGRNEIFVSWNPPEGPVGRINRYEVTMNGEMVYSGIERCCSVRGLLPSHEYTFTVTVWTSEGKCVSEPASKRTAKTSAQRKQRAISCLRSKSMVGISSQSRVQVDVVDRPKTTAISSRDKLRRQSFPNGRNSQSLDASGIQDETESVIKLQFGRRHLSPGSTPPLILEEKVSPTNRGITTPTKISLSEDRLGLCASAPIGRGSAKTRDTPTMRECISPKGHLIPLIDRLSPDVHDMRIDDFRGNSAAFAQALSDLKDVRSHSGHVLHSPASRSAWRPGPRTSKLFERKPNL